MAIQIQLRQGTTTEHATFKGASGELTYDTTLKSLVLHDGVTLGGVKIPYLSNGLIPSTMLPTATESVVGASKIATTEISKAGTNDTDFLTAKKLRDALNAQGVAPISACRAWLSVNTVTSTILQSFNIASFVKSATGSFEIVFATPMPHSNYVAFTNSIMTKGGGSTANTMGVTFNATKTNTTSTCFIWAWSTSNGALLNPEVLNIGVFC